jgi:predicted nucleotidyltransferase
MPRLTTDLTAEINRRLVAEFDPDQIILFGSHAWGMPGEDSDVDLLVIVPDTDERPSARAARGHRCLRGIPLPMDLIVKSRGEMARSARVSASLEAEILDRGKVLYGRSEAGTGEPENVHPVAEDS